MENEVNVSNYEKNVIQNLEGENLEKIAERAYLLAVSKIKTQIHLLKGKKVEQEVLLEKAEDQLFKLTYTQEFNLLKYDQACDNVEKLKDELKAIKATIKNRKELLDKWA